MYTRNNRQLVSVQTLGPPMMLPIFHLRRLLPESWRSRLRFIVPLLPKHWFYLTNDRRFWWFTGEAQEMQNRARLVRYDLQEGCFMETYLNDQIGADGARYFGPAACLVVHGSEIVRFDCLEHAFGHYHVATPYPHGIRKGLVGEIRLPEKTVEEQVERTIFELQQTRTTTCKHTRDEKYATRALTINVSLRCAPK